MTVYWELYGWQPPHYALTATLTTPTYTSMRYLLSICEVLGVKGSEDVVVEYRGGKGLFTVQPMARCESAHGSACITEFVGATVVAVADAVGSLTPEQDVFRGRHIGRRFRVGRRMEALVTIDSYG